MKAHRPKLTKTEREKFVKDVLANQKKYVYDSKDATKAFIKNKIEKALPIKTIRKVLPQEVYDKCFGVKGNFCSNLAGKHLPERLFKVHKTVVMPKDFWNKKNFREIGEISIKETHLPASTKSLGKFVGKPALVAAGAVLLADRLGVF